MSPASEVRFTVTKVVPLDAATTYELLCDWEDHGRWVPFTEVVVHSPESFVAFTGIGPVKLEDNMSVVSRDDDAMRVEIVKTGPVIVGSASFTVRPFSEHSSIVDWTEVISVPYLPTFLAPAAASIGKILFAVALRGLPPR